MLDGGGHTRNAFILREQIIMSMMISYTTHHNIWYGGVLSKELIRRVTLPKRVF